MAPIPAETSPLVQLRNYRDTDAEALIALLAQEASVFPRSPHILNPEFPPLRARQVVRAAMADGTFCPEGITMAEWEGEVIGTLSMVIGKPPEVGQIRWLAVRGGHAVPGILHPLLGRGMAFVKTLGCTRVRLTAWTDERHQEICQGLEDAGFLRENPEPRNILMGAPLSDLLRIPDLPPGYWSHTFRPGDEGRWLAAKNEIFSSQDPPGTFEKTYSERPGFDPDEVTFVEYGDELVGICAGVRCVHEVDGQRFPMAYLDWVGVKSEHRGKQLGAFVCLSCMHFLKRKGESRSTLITQPFRKAAVSLYTRLGFRLITEDRAYERGL